MFEHEPQVEMHVTRRGRQGPTWVLLHASASHGRAFDPMAHELAAEVTTLAPDLLGEGRTATPSGFDDLITRELRALEHTLRDAPWPLCIVGHSYGGVIALELARLRPERVAQLVLIEPVAFHLLRDQPSTRGALEIADVKRACTQLTASDRPMAAAERFVTFWAGEAAWRSLPEPARRALSGAMRKVALGWPQIEALPATVADYGRLSIPTLIVRGQHSREATRSIAAQLALAMPNARLVELPRAGHMSVQSHPRELAAVLREHLLGAQVSGAPDIPRHVPT